MCMAEIRLNGGGMRQDDAERTAARLFLWLSGEPDLAGAFLAEAGLAAADIAAIAARPEFLAAVTDFILQDDARVIAAAAAAGVAPQDVAQVRAALPGGQAWHWT
jgi:hypothetical protein